MKREQQIDINEFCEIAKEKCYDEFYNKGYGLNTQLNYCQARVYYTDNYIVLRSYDTIVACIDCCTGDFYDFLRFVYGYTATSSQHIAKFKKYYRNRFIKEFTWRYIK